MALARPIHLVWRKANRLQVRQVQAHLRKELTSMMDPEIARERAGWNYYSSIAKLGLEKGKSVLELGCGPGKFVAMLSALGLKVTGVDPLSFEFWDLIKTRQSSTKLMAGVYAESLPFESESFDFVTCMAALMYFRDPNKALDEIRRVLKSNGKAVIRTVNRWNFYTLLSGQGMDPASKNFYTMEELISLCEKHGFRTYHSDSQQFWPPVLPNFWWYLMNVAMPYWVHDLLSWLTPRRFRGVNTVFLEKL